MNTSIPNDQSLETSEDDAIDPTEVRELLAWPQSRMPSSPADAVCTCPSGDGSLRWPCLVHKSAHAAAGVTLEQIGARFLEELCAYRPDFKWVESPVEIIGQLVEELAAARQARYPEIMTPAIADALSTMLWQSGRIAYIYRVAGHDILTKAEAEQAFVLDRHIRLAIEHGDDWRQKAAEEIREIRELVIKQGTTNQERTA